MNIFFDNIIFSLQKSGGISSYWYELLTRVIEDEKFEVRYLEDLNCESNIFRKNLNIEKTSLQFYKTDFFSRIFPIKIQNSKNAIFHSSYYRYTNNKHSKVITTVHDFIQEKVNNTNLGFNSIMKKRAIINSDEIIVISENTKVDLLNFFPKIDPDKIHVIYNGVSDCYFPVNDLKQDTFDSILFVGSRVDYKNFDLAIDVVSKFSKLKLNIIGNALTQNELKLLNSKFGPDRWNFILNPSNYELNNIYNQSALLLYPSSYEGFGIPILEAMKAGCPVLALNSSSIPEVAGNAAVLVNNSTVDEYYNGIQQILGNREYYVQLGFVNAARFSWNKTYLETIKLYKN